MRWLILFVLLSTSANAAFVGEVTSNDIVTYSNPSDPPLSSSGGGGGGCSVNYVCGDWGDCINNTQTQICYSSCNKQNKTYIITCESEIINTTEREVIEDENIIHPSPKSITMFAGNLILIQETDDILPEDVNLDIFILVLASIYFVYELIKFISVYKGKN